ncbi:diguanylate cyclase [Actinoplanes rectilineatus]|uniref:diguanylate cyclase n=1 Tax=Actinoplanes rectilineatus TaxID=113571 RepID=UPI000A729BE8|nr:diguanylate cyclase [Actinoplanes rectilineatus]
MRKAFTGADAEIRLHQEALVLRRLAGLPGVPVLLGVDAEARQLELADHGERDLGCPVEDPAELVAVATAVASVLAGLHERGVLHRNITPAAVRRDASGTPRLDGFELATTYPLERPRFTHHSEISGTLAYLSPEQTGRTGRPVDQRSDLYSLGATLYELAAGRPPFTTGDPLQLLHDHLTRTPEPLTGPAPHVPPLFAAMVARLLAKDPDRRYQSADGLLHDLRRLAAEFPAADFALGERDFPWELTAPSRVIGRDAEITTLEAALTAALRGTGNVILVSGPSGAGKSALIDQLRPLVATAGGWFVAGKFDQFRRGPDADGVRQVFRALGQMLLAEPPAELCRIRALLTAGLAAGAGIIAAVVPELATALDIEPETDMGDPVHALDRLRLTGIEIVRIVAAARPLVMVVDDLQWSHGPAIDFVDGVIDAGAIPGFLFVGSHRDDPLPAIHPLATALARWPRAVNAPTRLPLANLPDAETSALIREMLRLPVDRVGELLATVAERGGGNPFETIELINALRRGGALRPAEDGWAYDDRRGRSISAGADVIADQLEALPGPARHLVEVLCCLGGDVAADSLSAAAGFPAVALLGPGLQEAIESGLVVIDRTLETYAFRHDRIRQVVNDGMPAGRRGDHHLAIARALESQSGHQLIVAEQYLLALDRLGSPDERAHVAALLCAAAADARRSVNYRLAEQMLIAVPGLTTDPDLVLRTTLERQAVLLATGRFEQAADLYHSADLSRAALPVRLAAAELHLIALTCQNRLDEALRVGRDTLAACGMPVPADPVRADEAARAVRELTGWAATGSAEQDAAHPRAADALADAVDRVVNRFLQAAYLADDPLYPWLIRVAAHRWTTDGPSTPLTGPLANGYLVLARWNQDYVTGHRILRRMMRFAELAGVEPDATFARFLHSVSAAAFFEPLRAVIALGHEMHERLIRVGGSYDAAFTFAATTPLMLDCAADLDDARAEAERGMAFAAATHNRTGAQNLEIHRQFVAVLSGTRDAIDAERLYAGTGTAVFGDHVYHALAALLLGDRATLVRQADRAAALIPAFSGLPTVVTAHLVHALALGDTGRAGTTAFAEHLAWFEQRAAETPGNFAHLASWLRAERARGIGDLPEVVRAFDRAQRDADGVQRPWHQALIAERYGRYLVEQQAVHLGKQTLGDACRRYAAWGAHRKAADLRAEFRLPDEDAPAGPGRVTAQSVDLLAVLRSSQAISSETRLDRLVPQLSQVLCALTGATAAHLVIHDPDRAEAWTVATAGGDLLPLADPAAGALLPVTVARYAARTREPLIVVDATADDRFAHDPFLRPLEQCSLLAVPVLNGGLPTAVLILENTDSRGAFATHRLDTVSLLTGQLSVSVNNALLYAALERKVADRTRELADANAQLARQAGTDALTGLPNRRRLDDAHDTVAVAMIDIDWFKPYNDHYGHQAGDECLRRVASAIGAAVRQTDVVIRYGGEEFAVLLADADEHIALQVAERIRAAVHALGEPHAAAPRGHVTVSIGVATAPAGPGTPVEALLRAADSRLYQAKREGRDRVSGAA